MSAIVIGIVSAGLMFGGCLFGFWLQRRLPAHHLDKDSHEIVKLATGMIATITALVLGLLVSSAKGTYDAINDGIRQTCAKTLLLDRTLSQYGPDARAARDQIKLSVAASLEAGRMRGPAVSASAGIERRFTNRVERIQAALRGLSPEDDGQRLLLGEAQQLAFDMSQARWVLMEAVQNELPFPLLVILVCWLSVIFVSLGLYSPRNGTVIVVLGLCACSMAAALFLILEMNRPLDGIFKVSGAPILEMMGHLGR